MMASEMVKASTGAIWASFSGRLRGFIAKRVRNENDVDDILQDVFAKIHTGLGGVKEGEKLEAWLFQVARRSIVDHVRSRAGKRRAAALPADLAGKTGEADVSAEVAGWLEPMMELLRAEDRELLRLADLEGVSQKELAARLNLSVTGTKSRVQRARQRLKETLLECCHVEMDRRGNAIDYTRKGGSCGSCSCS
jgi:RNA polymerase sigma-70 factor (ECF subfamily)